MHLTRQDILEKGSQKKRDNFAQKAACFLDRTVGRLKGNAMETVNCERSSMFPQMPHGFPGRKESASDFFFFFFFFWLALSSNGTLPPKKRTKGHHRATGFLRSAGQWLRTRDPARAARCPVLARARGLHILGAENRGRRLEAEAKIGDQQVSVFRDVSR